MLRVWSAEWGYCKHQASPQPARPVEAAAAVQTPKGASDLSLLHSTLST